MDVDIIIVNSHASSANVAAQYVYLKGEDWVYTCDGCNTWEVYDFKVPQEELICWCCDQPYSKYIPSSKNYS